MHTLLGRMIFPFFAVEAPLYVFGTFGHTASAQFWQKCEFLCAVVFLASTVFRACVCCACICTLLQAHWLRILAVHLVLFFCVLLLL